VSFYHKENAARELDSIEPVVIFKRNFGSYLDRKEDDEVRYPNENDEVRKSSTILPLKQILVKTEGPQTTVNNLNLQPTTQNYLQYRKSQKFRRKVLITAEYRGGSTFSAELFNQNKQASYLFESLYMTRRIPSTTEKKLTSAKILRDYFENCNYPSLEKYYLNTDVYKEQNFTSFREDKDYNICRWADTCFQHMDKELNALFKKFKSKPNQNYEIKKAFKESCLSKTITSTKVIRIYHLNTLENLKDLENFYIIYIVRDPRGLFNSRLSAVGDWHPKPKEWAEQNILKQCVHFNENLRYIMTSSQGEWIRKKIKIVRYEDLAMQPGKFAREIYDFIESDDGFEELEKEFLGLTTYEQEENENESTGHESHQDHVQIKSRYATTNRNSKKVASKWVDSLSFPVVKALQTGCGEEFFKNFGYRYYNEENEFKAAKEDYLYSDFGEDSSYFGSNLPLLEKWVFSESGGRPL